MAYIDDFQDEINRLYRQAILDEYNNTVGHLQGTDCPICKNKGSVRKIIDGKVVDVPCECMSGRAQAQQIEESGLGQRTKKCTFTTFKRNENWQRKIYDTAWLSSLGGNGFFIGGKPGCGKTHICIAIVQRFMEQGKKCRYVAWGELVTILKHSMYSDNDTYNDTMEKLKNADVLFIDDLFRTEVTNADKGVLFSLIDYRYNQVEGGRKLFTIISSERYLSELSEIDEAIGRRIEALTEGYAVNVPREERYKYKK